MCGLPNFLGADGAEQQRCCSDADSSKRFHEKSRHRYNGGDSSTCSLDIAFEICDHKGLCLADPCITKSETQSARNNLDKRGDKLEEGVTATVGKFQPVPHGVFFGAEAVEEHSLAVHQLQTLGNP